ncbi:MAG: hypothetical protein DWI63_05265 [Chloroflexi bacterium]|nr:MAG: hypothetical protein DWI63_05265 [Chloroflexota bacterium]
MVAAVLPGALLMGACGLLPAAGAYGVVGEQPAFETAVAAGVATALFETQQAPQAAGANGLAPSFVMEQVLRDARADIEQMVAVAVATAVAGRSDLPAGELPAAGATAGPGAIAAGAGVLSATVTPVDSLFAVSPVQPPLACIDSGALFLGNPVKSVNMRAGPGSEYPEAGALRMSECLRLSTRNQLGNWVFGELCTLQPDGSCRRELFSAWAARRFLAITGDADRLPVATPIAP